MTSNQIPIESLHEIKETLEQKISESTDSSDSDYSTSTSSTSSSSSRSSKKKSKNTDYKLKYNKLESKIRYMQLDTVNKDLEIMELRSKVDIHTKNEILFSKINMLFERLDNAYKILTERSNIIIDPNILKFKTISDLTTIKGSCTKVQEKYLLYINNEVYPLINNQYLKNAISALYDIKQKEYLDLLKSIDLKIYNTKFNNTAWMFLFVVISVLLLQIIIITGCYMLGYF
jgi:hypothetical protein